VKAPWLSVDVIEDAGDWSRIPAAGALIEAAAAALADHPSFKGRAAAVACVALSADSEIRALNKTYRGQDKPTNVLSFPATPEGGTMPALQLGDVMLALETLLKEASELGIDPRHHLQHLVVHGLLHLLGYDHLTEDEAQVMESLEAEILAQLGIADPYVEDSNSAFAKIAGAP
jgi:probable rRNA maturation factor